MDLMIIFIAFILGLLVQRVYLARSKGITSTLGTSWEYSSNRVYKLYHRIYCELCPRRIYCERYKKEVVT